MLFNKGLALGGAMLVVAVPGQSALLHAQSFEIDGVESNTGTGDSRFQLSAVQRTAMLPRTPQTTTPTLRAALLPTPVVQSPVAQVSAAQPTVEAPVVQPVSAVQSRPAVVASAPVAIPAAATGSTTRQPTISFLSLTPGGVNEAMEALNASIFGWLQSMGLVPAAPAVTPPAPTPAPETVVTPPAPTPAPEPETSSVSDVVDAVVEAVSDAVGAVVDAVADAAGAVVDAAGSVLSPPLSSSPIEAVTPSQPTAPVAEEAPAPAPTQPAEEQAAAKAPSPSVAKVFTVSTQTELRQALAAAQTLAGAEIRVNPGNYGDLVWNYKKYPLGRVYIVPATAIKPVFRSIQANASNNISFHGIKVTGLATGRLVQMNSSQDMSLTGSEISGLTDDKNPWDEGTTGVQVRFSTNVVVQDNVFSDLRVALFVQRSNNVFVRYNRLHYLREGMNIAAANNLQIRGNHFSHFFPRYDLKEHPDAIQFWTNNETVGSTKVLIAENLIATGGQRAVQGIFGGSEVVTARHSDWKVTRNVYYGSSPHGLSFSRIDNLKVWNNVVAASPHADVNNSIRTATTSGGYIPRVRARFEAHMEAWNNIMMTAVSSDSTSTVNQFDNFDIVDNVGGAGQPWTDFFVGGRPDEEAPPLEAFLTRNPSVAYTRQAGITAPFVHGARALPQAEQLQEVHSLLKL